MSDRAEAYFHIVRRSTNLHELSQQLYGDSGSANAQDFRRINTVVADSSGQVLQGQFLFMPEGACRADEQGVAETLVGVNGIILGQMDWMDRRSLAEGYQFLDNAATNPQTVKTAIGIVNSSASGLLSTGSLQTRQIGRVLSELEQRYVQTYRAHGRLTPQFYAYRQRTFRTLDTALGRLVRNVTLGSPLKESAKRTLKVNTKSQILYWSRNGAAGGVRDFKGHFNRLHTVNRYFRFGGYATIGIDAMLTASTISEACHAGDERHCLRTSVVETGGLVGRVGGGIAGAALGYGACNAVLGGPTWGTSVVWCALVVGGTGSYLGSQWVGGGAKWSAETLYDNTYRIVR
ncbi:MAG: hypothetical protein WD609_18155 [Aquisalimonadaceae bacterium]